MRPMRSRIGGRREEDKKNTFAKPNREMRFIENTVFELSAISCSLRNQRPQNISDAGSGPPFSEFRCRYAVHMPTACSPHSSPLPPHALKCIVSARAMCRSENVSPFYCHAYNLCWPRLSHLFASLFAVAGGHSSFFFFLFVHSTVLHAICYS